MLSRQIIEYIKKLIKNSIRLVFPVNRNVITIAKYRHEIAIFNGKTVSYNVELTKYTCASKLFAVVPLKNFNAKYLITVTALLKGMNTLE